MAKATIRAAINPQTVSKYAAISAAYLVIAFGISVIIGWHTHTEYLIRYEPDIIAIVYNTALCFILLGVGILAFIHNIRSISQIVSWIVLLAGIAGLSQHIFNVDLGIDQVFFEHYDTFLNAYPGRMAPNTAVCFILTSVGLLLLSFPKPKEPNIIICNALSLLVLCLALLFVCGYSTKVQDTYAWGVVTPMSLNSALGFIILSISLLCCSIYKGFSINAQMFKATPITGFMCIFIITILFAFKVHAYESFQESKTNVALYILIIGNIFAIKFGFMMNALVLARSSAELSKKSLSLMQATLDATAEGVLAISIDSTISTYNKKFIEMWEVPPEKLMNGREELINFLATKIENKQFFFLNLKRVMTNPEQSRVGDIELKNGNIYECSVNPQFLDAKIIGRVWSFRDITMQKNLECELLHQSNYDSLTELPNKSLILELVARSIQSVKNSDKIVGVFLIDIDKFAYINDLFGRNNGDVLLKRIGAKIKKNLPVDSVVGRIGSDQFLVVSSGINKPEQSVIIINNVMEAFASPYAVYDHELVVTACVGVAFYPKDGLDADELIGNADIAKMRAKQDGRNKFQFYNKDMNYFTIQQIELETRLHKAIEQKQFVVYYQPIISLKNNNIIGAEALVRWNDPEKGLIMPINFIPLAENLGLIQHIGEMVLLSACSQAKKWQESGWKNFKMAINISAHQFKYSPLKQTIEEVLTKTGMNPLNLELELTESVLIEGSEEIKATILDLSAMGVSISIDDFGTGYSSLSYLKKFAVDKLKIDKSFINDLIKDADDESLVRAIIAMAKSLKLTALAEGVETIEQLEVLKKLGCDQAQGFYFAKPMPAENFSNILNLPGKPID